ncbi:MAG TPA: hypothetical protein VGE74_08255, partial [Gemmata sp.]
DPEAFEQALQAIDAEREGNLALAEKLWAKVKGRFPEEAKLPYTTDEPALARARWGWLADKRIADAKAADGELRALQEQIRNSQIYDRALKFDPASPESLALRVQRLMRFPDPDKAARTCDTLIAMTEKDPGARVWYLVGCKLRFGRPASAPDPLKVRVDNINLWLDQTERTAKQVASDPDNPERPVWERTVRTRCREVTELYDDDEQPAVREAVQRAEKIVDSLPKKS